MILETLALLAVSPAAINDPEQVWIGLHQKLAFGRFNTKAGADGKLVECSVTKTTGDAELDASFCEITRFCWDENVGNTKGRVSCMDRRQEDFLRELALKRASENISNEETEVSAPDQ